MKIIFVTYCDSWLYEKFGCKKLINSFKYFHPDISIIWYNEKDTDRIMQENPGFTRVSYTPIIMKEVKNKYNAEFVVKIDADSLCLARLNEILNCDYEIASVRNDGDHIGNSDERQNRPRELWDLPNEKYVNCGCVSTNSEKFLNEWIFLNKKIIDTYGGVKSFWMCDQNWMNVLFHYGSYNSKILDPLGGNLFYGTSANIPSSINKYEIPEHIIKEYKISNWTSWKDIEYKNENFWLYGKECKLLHFAGGGSSSAIKLSFDMFNPDIIDKLKEITQCNE